MVFRFPFVGVWKVLITFTLNSILPLYFLFPFKTMELIVKSQPAEQKKKKRIPKEGCCPGYPLSS